MRPHLLVFLIVLAPIQTRGQVVLNELFPNAPGSMEDGLEWVEIFNAGAAAVDVTGWAIEDAATIDMPGIRRAIPEDFDPAYGTSAILQPGEFRVVRGAGVTYLNNTGDTVYLVSDRTGNLAAVVYSSAYQSAPEGSCWANLPDGAEPPSVAWRACTPGTSNCAADATPPAAVSDLVAATGTYAGEVDLTWHAVGNDGLTGTALQHVVKYNTVPITPANFDASFTAFNTPPPGPPGTLHGMTVFALVPGQTYYFAIKTKDCQNTAAISTTVPSATAGTLPLPFTDHTAGLQPWFGNLHSHTSYSDGTSTPAAAYQYARTQAPTPLDFLAVTDHNHGGAGPMTPALYQQGRAEAAAANADGQFVAIYGQEWGLAANGHVNIFEAPVLFGWEPGRFDVFVAQDDYSGLYAAIQSNPGPWGALASLCHPGASDFEGFAWSAAGAEVLRGIALVNGPFNAAVTDESAVGNTNFDPQYLTALRRGFFVSPVGDQDNHEPNWGASTQSRTAVLATSLTKDAILGGIAERRTYATQDHNAVVDFQADGYPMGTHFYVPVGWGVNFDVEVSDPDGEGMALFELFRGTPGGDDAVLVATAEGVPRFVHRDEETPVPGSGEKRLYFLRLTQADNHRLWTAPVEVTFGTLVDVAERGGPPGLGARLHPAQPNPFNPGTELRFELLGAGMQRVTLRLFDVRGRAVCTLVDAALPAGSHVVPWSGRDDRGRPLASGVYMAQLLAPGVDARTRLVLVR